MDDRARFERLEAALNALGKRVNQLEDWCSQKEQREMAREDRQAASGALEVTAAMKELSYTLLQHPQCQEGWQKFLRDVQGKTTLSEKQMKFWRVIHKECLGYWPPRPWEETQQRPDLPPPAPIPEATLDDVF